MLLTHPVPVAVFLLFAGLHWAIDLACAVAPRPALRIQALRLRHQPDMQGTGRKLARQIEYVEIAHESDFTMEYAEAMMF